VFTVLNELRKGIRLLWKSPGFTVVAALSLTLGIGATTTFFSVLYGVVLRQPPYPDAGRLVELHDIWNGDARNSGLISQAELFDFRERQRSLVGIGGAVRGRATLSQDQGAERVLVTRVTANLFPLLGSSPIVGRSFTTAEERGGSNHVAILNYDFWKSNFGGATKILGQTLRLNGIGYTVIGVMPPGFSYDEPGTSVWTPLDLSSHGDADRDDRSLFTVARLSPGVNLERARVDLDRVARQLESDQPKDYPASSHWSVVLRSMRESEFGSFKAPLGAMMAAAAAVLLIACVNVSIMFLLRAAKRRREILTRLALGAAPRHIIQQLMAESIVVCALGTLGGVALAYLGLDLLKTFPPSDIPRLQEVSLNGAAAIFAVSVLLLITVIVGLAPVTAVLRTRLSEGFTQTNRATEGRVSAWLRDSLTVMEIALAVVLLAGAGLTLRSLNRLLQVDLGFSTTRLLSFKTNLTEQAYPDAARANLFYDQLSAKIAAMPGVLAVGAISYVPLSGEAQSEAVQEMGSAGSLPASAAGWCVVRGPYFSAMGQPLLRGRFFSEADQPNAPPVVIIDDKLASRFWPTPEAALGQQLRFGKSPDSGIRTVVGVVRQAKHFGPGKDSLPDAYVPQAQVYQRGMYTVVKTSGSAERLVPLVRAALASIDSSVPMYFTETMEQRYDEALALNRFTAGLIGSFSTLALALAGVGIFGVTGYSVSQRTREFGIRLSLGAQRVHIVRLVLGRVGILALLGACFGAAIALEVGRLGASLLFGIGPVDPLAILTAVGFVAVIALLATLGPLANALRVDPVEAIRTE
jgi:predicted permease